MSLKNTRAIIDAMHSGELAKGEFFELPVFHLQVPKKIEGINEKVLNPIKGWTDKKHYDHELNKLGE